ncbi:hypothetical protein Tco_0487812 [Tanacetum coccineum]
MTVVTNEDNELIPIRLVTGWRVCTDYRKLNDATRKDHSPLPFMDQMLERLAGNEYYCFLDGFSGYFQIPIDPQDQENLKVSGHVPKEILFSYLEKKKINENISSRGPSDDCLFVGDSSTPVPGFSREQTSDNNRGYDLPFCDNFVTFSNPLFDFNDDFTSSDEESFPEEDVHFTIYSNPLFEFDDNYISSDVNPLFNEILEDIKSEDSSVSNFDESVLLNTPLSNEDECFDPRGDIDEIDAFLAI